MKQGQVDKNILSLKEKIIKMKDRQLNQKDKRIQYLTNKLSQASQNNQILITKDVQIKQMQQQIRKLKQQVNHKVPIKKNKQFIISSQVNLTIKSQTKQIQNQKEIIKTLEENKKFCQKQNINFSRLSCGSTFHTLTSFKQQKFKDNLEPYFCFNLPIELQAYYVPSL